MFETMTIDNLNHFLNKLKSFDRYYSFSDDGSVYRKGKAQEDEIKRICLNKDFQVIHDLWTQYVEKKKEGMTEDAFYRQVLDVASNAMVEHHSESAALQNIAELPTVPLALEEKPTEQGDEFAEPIGQEPMTFENANRFLIDSTAATEYISKRLSDVVKLYEIIKWRDSGRTGVVTANIYTAKVTRGFSGCGNLNNTITTQAGTVHYNTENCLLAYILATFW